MRDLWRLSRRFIAPEDVGFELPFHRYGGARGWVADRLALPRDASVLEIGYGQGLFTVELASRVPKGVVVGIDKLAGPTISEASRWLARRARVGPRVALMRADAFRLPFPDGTFDAIASFLAMDDIVIASGRAQFPSLCREIGRVARPGGTVGLADDCFPESRLTGAQGRLFDSMRRCWRNLLPPVARLGSMLEVAGVRDISVQEFDPGESLAPKDAERELRLGATWAEPQGIFVDFPKFWREAGDILRREGRRYSRLLLVTGTKAG